MKLDRNINGRGKYALIKLRSAPSITERKRDMCIESGDPLIVAPECVDFCDDDDAEFFVIRLKDKYAAPALAAYAGAAMRHDAEFAREVYALAAKAATHQNQKAPD